MNMISERAMSSCRCAIKECYRKGNKLMKLPFVLEKYRRHFDKSKKNKINMEKDEELYAKTYKMISKLEEPKSYYEYRKGNTDVNKVIDYADGGLSSKNLPINGTAKKHCIRRRNHMKYNSISNTITCAKTELGEISNERLTINKNAINEYGKIIKISNK